MAETTSPDLETVVREYQRGIDKRIDEGREMAELLTGKFPELFKNYPWVIGWMESQDAFLVALKNASKTVDNNNQNLGGRGYPRPWPKLDI